MKHLFLVLSLCALTALVACNSESEDSVKTPTLLGTWEVQSIHWITSDTTYNIDQAQLGLLLLNEDTYSIMWTPTVEPRTPFEVLSRPTDEETIAGFRSVVFNGGTYVKTDSTFTTTALIAKVPGFEGGQQFFRYQLKGDDMEITMYDEIYPDGTRPDWYGNVETKFVLKRMGN